MIKEVSFLKKRIKVEPAGNEKTKSSFSSLLSHLQMGGSQTFWDPQHERLNNGDRVGPGKEIASINAPDEL